MCLFVFQQVKAAKFGHILVVDEADKAPTNVTCILKTLVESKEMILADGRRIISGTNTHTEKNISLFQLRFYGLLRLIERPLVPAVCVFQFNL